VSFLFFTFNSELICSVFDSITLKLQIVYRAVQDAIRNLDYALLRCDSVESLFGSELLSRRNKVKDLCENTLLESPKALGPVIRDRLWRSVFYNVLGRAKRLKPVRIFSKELLLIFPYRARAYFLDLVNFSSLIIIKTIIVVFILV